LREVSEKALKTTRFPKFSPRLKSRAVRLAAAASLVAYFRESDEPTVPIGPMETDFSRRFYEEEVHAREGRRGAIAR
jgi:hypothetical protein